MTLAKRDGGRRGAVVVVVMLCLLALATIGAASLRAGLQERDVLRDAEARLQAEWLLRSGRARAEARLGEGPSYEGETWEISREDLGGIGPARVRIGVSDAGGGAGRKVSVRAELSGAGDVRARRGGEWVVEGSSKGTP